MLSEKNCSPTGHRIPVPPSMIPVMAGRDHRATSVSLGQASSSSQTQCPWGRIPVPWAASQHLQQEGLEGDGHVHTHVTPATWHAQSCTISV